MEHYTAHLTADPEKANSEAIDARWQLYNLFLNQEQFHAINRNPVIGRCYQSNAARLG